MPLPAHRSPVSSALAAQMPALTFRVAGGTGGALRVAVHRFQRNPARTPRIDTLVGHRSLLFLQNTKGGTRYLLGFCLSPACIEAAGRVLTTRPRPPGFRYVTLIDGY